MPAFFRPNGIQTNSNKPKGGNYRHFGNIIGGDWNLQIALLQSQLAEYGTTVQTSYQVSHAGERVLVFYRLQIEKAVVAAGPPGAVLFLDHV